jgi:uncharacterized protein YidB (DUF937 family)
MSRGFPSMTALLGMLAIAGYQNRDKIAEMLKGLSAGPQGSAERGGSPDRPATLDGLFGNLASALGGASAGSVLGGGLGELADRFRQAGQGETVDSWVGTGPNKDVAPRELETVIGPDVLATLSQQTGLSQEELLARLSRELPRAVDQYTPHGRLPTDSDPL